MIHSVVISKTLVFTSDHSIVKADIMSNEDGVLSEFDDVLCDLKEFRSAFYI